MINKARSIILDLLANAFDYAKIPYLFYEAIRKSLISLGLHYTKIDDCLNYYMLYHEKDNDREFCKFLVTHC